MYCPKCKAKTAVTITMHNDDFNEVYRRRRCKECGYSFYTAEVEKEAKGAFRIMLSQAAEARAKGVRKYVRSK